MRQRRLCRQNNCKCSTHCVCTSCCTSMGISRIRLFMVGLNGLIDRRGDIERSIDVLIRRGCGGGLIAWPLLVGVCVASASGLNGISTIGLVERRDANSVWNGDRNMPLFMGHGVRFFDIFSLSRLFNVSFGRFVTAERYHTRGQRMTRIRFDWSIYFTLDTVKLDRWHIQIQFTKLNWTIWAQRRIKEKNRINSLSYALKRSDDQQLTVLSRPKLWTRRWRIRIENVHEIRRCYK